MNKGVEILLKRMESNPEEFDYDGWLSKWAQIYTRYESVLTQEERDVFEAQRTKVLRERFEVEVMSKLLGVTPLTAKKELDEDDMKLIQQCIGDQMQTQMAKALDASFLESIEEKLDPTGGFVK